jgi:hypothetical protein
LLLTTRMGRSSSSRWTTTGLRRSDQRPTKPGLAATAILHQEGQEAPDSFKIDEINDRPPLFVRGNETGAGKCCEMEGERVLRQLEPPRDVARRHPVGSALDEETEDLKPALLRQRAKRTDRG